LLQKDRMFRISEHYFSLNIGQRVTCEILRHFFYVKCELFKS